MCVGMCVEFVGKHKFRFLGFKRLLFFRNSFENSIKKRRLIAGGNESINKEQVRSGAKQYRERKKVRKKVRFQPALPYNDHEAA